MRESPKKATVLPVGVIRRCAERLLGRLTIIRRLPADSGRGRLFVNARVGGLKYLFKRAASFDPELLRIAQLLVRPGDCIWDIGANVGLFSMAAQHCSGPTGKVFAIEADQEAVSLLFSTARYADDRLTVLPIAISDKDGFVRFSIACRARAANAIEGFGSTQTGGVLEVRTLPAWRLDTLAEHFQAPSVLKIDVEGAEIDVLRGAARMLVGNRPRVYCEVNGSTRDEVVGLLQSSGYDVFDGESFGTRVPRAVDARTTNLVGYPKGGSGPLP